LQLQGQVRHQQAANEKAQVIDLALKGNAEAKERLARIDYDMFAKLDKTQKEAIAAESKLFGDVSFDLLNTPIEQRRDKYITYARQFPQFEEQINQLAFDPPEEQERKLRALALQAELGMKLYEMDRPQDFNIGPGEGRYERDPRTGEIRAIVQPNYGGAPAFAPAAPQGGGQVSSKTIGGVTYYQNPSTGVWYDNPQEAGAR
jgi:hypothetical protein